MDLLMNFGKLHMNFGKLFVDFLKFLKLDGNIVWFESDFFETE